MRKAPVSYYRQSIQLPEIREADPGGQGRWSAGSQQQTLRRLDKAFAAFFRRIRAGEKKPGYPRFKGCGWFDTIEWPAVKNEARWDSVPHPAVTRATCSASATSASISTARCRAGSRRSR